MIFERLAFRVIPDCQEQYRVWAGKRDPLSFPTLEIRLRYRLLALLGAAREHVERLYNCREAIAAQI